MSHQNPIPRRAAVAAHPNVMGAMAECPQVAAFLEERGVEVVQGSLYDDNIRQHIQKKNVDLLVALGGDGTMLRAGHLCGPVGIPVLGINLGRFGFLIEVERDQWRSTFPLLLEGDYWIENRMVLRAEHWHQDQMEGTWDVLNEVVVTRGSIIRPVHLSASVDGHFLTTYVADGLIVATPTGSTAYALAAGGPILPPEVRNILIVPVAPHLSVTHPVVLAEGSTVQITVNTTHQASLSADGQSPVAMSDGDTVHVSAGDYQVQFIRFQDPGYFFRNLISHMEQNPTTRSST